MDDGNAAVRPTDDVIQPFQIDGPGLRGRLIRLGASVDAVLGRHDYPEPVARLLGETLVLGRIITRLAGHPGNAGPHPLALEVGIFRLIEGERAGIREQERGQQERRQHRDGADMASVSHGILRAVISYFFV